jgi:hypothetical protein
MCQSEHFEGVKFYVHCGVEFERACPNQRSEFMGYVMTEKVKRKLAAILSADVKGYSRLDMFYPFCIR